MQTADEKGIQNAPLTCAICWKSKCFRKLSERNARFPHTFPQNLWKTFAFGLKRLFHRDWSFVPVGNDLVGAAQDRAGTRAISLPDKAFAFHHVKHVTPKVATKHIAQPKRG